MNRVRSALRAAVRGGIGFATKPLTLAQVFTNGAGALPVVIASARMGTSQFAHYSLLALAAGALLGLSRAALLQPALLYQRTDPHSVVPVRYAAPLALGIGLVFGLIAPAFGLPSDEIPILVAVGAAPVVYEWLRYRAMSQNRRWAVAIGDGTRFVVAVGVVLLPALPVDALTFQIVASGATLPAAAVVALQIRRIDVFTRYRSYSRPAMWQVLDYTVGQLVVTVPLLLLGSLGLPGALLGGARLAQTLLGPLNLAFAAASTNLLADSATSERFAAAQALVTQTRRTARTLALLAGSVVGAALLAMLLFDIEPRGVGRTPLIGGLLVVGASTIMSGWAGINILALRAFGYNARATIGRLAIVAATTTGFGIGYLVGGSDGSIAGGFLANAVAAPLVFGPLSARVYRAELGSTPEPRTLGTVDPSM